MATINVLGYPSSAAAYCLGVEQAPAALREAGLIGALEAAGHQVRDGGDLPVHRWRPDRERPLAQNLDEEVDALRGLANAVRALLVRASGCSSSAAAAPLLWGCALRQEATEPRPTSSTSTGTSTSTLPRRRPRGR